MLNTRESSPAAPRSPSHLAVRSGVLLTLLACATARAEGSVEARWLTVRPPQTLWDGLGLSANYQATIDGQSVALTTTLERRSQSFSVNYRRPQQAVQLNTNRRTDTDTSALTLSSTYTYAPTPPTSGAALNAITTLYNLNLNEQKTSTNRTQTFGISIAGRLAPNVNASATGVGNLVHANDTTTTSGVITTSVNYAKDKTSASLAASSNIQKTGRTLSLSASASTELAPKLTGNASVSWTNGQKPAATAAVNYAVENWTLNANASVADAKLSSVGANASVKLPDDLSISGTAAYAVTSKTPSLGVNASRKFGGLNVSSGVSASFPPQSTPTYTAQASLSGTQKPWNGNVNVNVTRSGNNTTGAANGTLSYNNDRLTIQTTLGLNLSSTITTTRTTTLTGSADLSTSYAINDKFSVSALARYERSTDPAAAAQYRFGAGLRYRF